MSRKKQKFGSASQEKSESLGSEPKNNEEQEFAELLEQADAVDRVMTKNGPPEYDWTSG